MPSSLPAHLSHFVLIHFPSVVPGLSSSRCSLFVCYLQLSFSHRRHSQVSSTFFCHCSRLIGFPNIIYSHAISLLLHLHSQTFYARVCAFFCMMLRNPSLGVRVVRFTINQTKVGIHMSYTTYYILSAAPNTSFSHVVHDSAYYSDETYTWWRRVWSSHMICLSTVPRNCCEVSAYIQSWSWWRGHLISFTSPLTGLPLTVRREMLCLSGLLIQVNIYSPPVPVHQILPVLKWDPGQ